MQALDKDGEVAGKKKVSSSSLSYMDHKKSLRLETSPEAWAKEPKSFSLAEAGNGL